MCRLSTIGKKLVKQRYLLQVSLQYGELRPIGLPVWGTPATFNRFRVLASLLQQSRSPEANQTLHDLWSSRAGTLYIHFWGFCPPDGILPRAKFTLPPSLVVYIFIASEKQSYTGRKWRIFDKHLLFVTPSGFRHDDLREKIRMRRLAGSEKSDNTFIHFDTDHQGKAQQQDWKINITRNRKHRRVATKPAACAKPLMLSKVGSHGGREGG